MDDISVEVGSMRYHNITKDDMLNGDGLRVVLWLSGCTHQCRNCHNPVTWDIHGGLELDPLHPENREPVGQLVKEIREKFPEKTIWMYTGFLWDEVCILDAVKNTDVLVDGRFEEDLKDTALKWRGSSNQQVIDVKKSLEQMKKVLYIR